MPTWNVTVIRYTIDTETRLVEVDAPTIEQAKADALARSVDVGFWDCVRSEPVQSGRTFVATAERAVDPS